MDIDQFQKITQGHAGEDFRVVLTRYIDGKFVAQIEPEPPVINKAGQRLMAGFATDRPDDIGFYVRSAKQAIASAKTKAAA